MWSAATRRRLVLAATLPPPETSRDPVAGLLRLPTRVGISLPRRLPAGGALPTLSSRGRSAPRSLFLATFLALWALSARQPPAGDATAMVAVARDLVTEGRLDSSYPMLGFTVVAPDGRHFSKYPLPWSLAEVPGQVLERLVSTAALPAADQEMALRLVRGLTPAAFGALSVLLLFLALAEAGIARRRALILSLLAHGTTCLLPYLASHYSEVFQAAIVNGAVWSLARLGRSPDRRNAAQLGLFLGTLVLAKVALAPFAAVAGLAALLILLRNASAPLRLGAWMVVAALPPLAAMMAWNLVRFGTPLSADYGFFLVPQTLGWPRFGALFGLLLSPGRGLAWFAPLLWLAWPGARRAWREVHAVGLACASGFVATLLLYSGFTIWHGSEQWGPRYLVPMVGPLAVLVGLALEEAGGARLFRRGLLVALAVAGLAVNVPGLLVRYTDFFAAVPYVPYSKIHLDANQQPLETPELDNLARTNFIPSFSPIVGHWWLLSHAVAGGDLESDCPWAQAVTTSPRIRTPGLEPRVELWFVPDPGWPASTRGTMIALLAVLLLAAAGAGVEAWRATAAGERGEGPGAEVS